MWPDTAVDAELELTDRLHNRIQSFHDLIGLDSKLLSESERLNEKEMYGIYNGQMPESDDGLDEVAANQRAIALLQRIQDDDPRPVDDHRKPAGWDTFCACSENYRFCLRYRRFAGSPLR